MIRELARWKSSDEWTPDWTIGLWFGWSQVAIGYRLERHPSEWAFDVYLGPFSIGVYRVHH